MQREAELFQLQKRPRNNQERNTYEKANTHAFTQQLSMESVLFY